MSNNIELLGNALAGRMQKSADAAVPVTIELGTINGNLSLSTDSLGSPIPKGEYMVSLHLSSGSYQTSVESHTHSGGAHAQYEGDGTHTHDGGEHDHRLPEDFRALEPGDRVLVAWAGNEPVVISIVVSS